MATQRDKDAVLNLLQAELKDVEENYYPIDGSFRSRTNASRWIRSLISEFAEDDPNTLVSKLENSEWCEFMTERSPIEWVWEDIQAVLMHRTVTVGCGRTRCEQKE